MAFHVSKNEYWHFTFHEKNMPRNMANPVSGNNIYQPWGKLDTVNE